MLLAVLWSCSRSFRPPPDLLVVHGSIQCLPAYHWLRTGRNHDGCLLWNIGALFGSCRSTCNWYAWSSLQQAIKTKEPSVCMLQRWESYRLLHGRYAKFPAYSACPLLIVVSAFVAGIVTTITTWRAVFWTLCVIYSIFTIITWWTVPMDDAHQLKGRLDFETLRKFDFLGALLAVAGIAMFVASLTLANDAPQGWKTSYVIALLVIGFVLIATFIWWQSVFKYPLVPLHIWRDRNFALLNIILCLGFYGFVNNVFWLTLLWSVHRVQLYSTMLTYHRQRVDHNNPLQVALRLLPQAIGGVCINVVAALIMHKVSNKILMIIGAVAYAISSALLSATQPNISWWALTFPALLLSVVGADFEFTVTNMYVMSSLPSEQQSVAGGLFNTVTRVSSSIGLGLSTVAFTSTSGSAHGDIHSSFRSYQSTFWVALAGAGLALFFLPFLTIRAQGAKRKKEKEEA